MIAMKWIAGTEIKMRMKQRKRRLSWGLDPKRVEENAGKTAVSRIAKRKRSETVRELKPVGYISAEIHKTMQGAHE